MTPFINQITINTGHNRRSPRSEVSDETISWLRPWLNTCLVSGEIQPLPAPDLEHFGALALAQEGSLVMTLYGRPVEVGIREPLLSFGVAQTATQSAMLWDLLTTDRKASDPPQTPWLAVRLYPDLMLHYLDDASWMGDFERCVAWTWITSAPQLKEVNHDQ